MLMFALLQAAQPAPAAELSPPDIQLGITATARRVVVERRGNLDLQVRTAVNEREGTGNVVDVQAPDVPEGRRRLDNVRVNVRAEARIPDPHNASPAQEPSTPQ